MCERSAYTTPLYEVNIDPNPYECPNEVGCSEPSVEKQDLGHGVESDSCIKLYDELGHLKITAKDTSFVHGELPGNLYDNNYSFTCIADAESENTGEDLYEEIA